MSSVDRLGEGDIFAGEYQIERVLREGTSPLYAVKQLMDGQSYSLRLLPRTVTQGNEQRRLLLAAAQLSTRIRCERCVKILKSGIETGSELPWLLGEPIAGEELESVLRQRGALPPEMVHAIFLQLGQALDAVHQAGLVHGALRPRNIWVTLSEQPSAELKLQLLDVGLAQLLAELDPAEGHRGSGVPQWLAPEQTQNLPIVPATDVWALGLLAFRLLTGAYYWREANRKPPVPLSVLREILVEQQPQARARAIEYGCAQYLPTGFDAWFARCLHPAVAGRYPNVQSAVDALLALLDGKPPEPAAIAAPAPALPSGGPGAAATAAPVATSPAPRVVSARRWRAARRILLLCGGAAVVAAFSMSVRIYYGRKEAAQRALDSVPANPAASNGTPGVAARSSQPPAQAASPGRPPAGAGSTPRSPASRVHTTPRSDIRVPTHINKAAPPPSLPEEMPGRRPVREPLARACTEDDDPRLCLGMNPPQAGHAPVVRSSPAAEPTCSDVADCLAQARAARAAARPDPTQALRLLTRACELGSGPACLETGRLLRSGEGALPDVVRARGYLAQGCDRGAEGACLEFLQLAKKACEQGDSKACVQAGRLAEKGRGVPRDIGQAEQLFERACRGQDIEGCQRLKALRSQPSTTEI